jgi:hypothetical protein
LFLLGFKKRKLRIFSNELKELKNGRDVKKRRKELVKIKIFLLKLKTLENFF